MVSRKDAISAKEGMERYRGQDMQLRVSSIASIPALDVQLNHFPLDTMGRRVRSTRL